MALRLELQKLTWLAGKQQRVCRCSVTLCGQSTDTLRSMLSFLHQLLRQGEQVLMHTPD